MSFVVSWAPTIPGRETKLSWIVHKAFTYGEILRTQGRIVELRSFVPKAGPHRDTPQMLGKLDDLSAKESTTLFLGYAFGDVNVLTALDWSKHVFQGKWGEYPKDVVQVVRT